jgi:uncharacterized membrane protein YqhA
MTNNTIPGTTFSPISERAPKNRGSLLHRMISSTRLSILVAIICSFVVAFTLLLYGALQTFSTVKYVLILGHSSKEAKSVILVFIEIIDLFLLATVFYITALGLYTLFIDDRVKVPSWLQIHSLDELKGKLASVIIVILSVVYLGQAVKWEGGTDILAFGVSISLVIAALTYFLTHEKKHHKANSDLSLCGKEVTSLSVERAMQSASDRNHY